MAKGKRSAKVNSSLRTQIQDAADARRRLERRLREAELDRDELRARLDLVEAHEHPAVAAAELRANAATDRAVTARQEASDQMIELVRLLVTGYKREADRLGIKLTWILTRDEMARIRTLGGPDLLIETMEASGTPVNRTSRRNLQRGGNEISTHLREVHRLRPEWAKRHVPEGELACPTCPGDGICPTCRGCGHVPAAKVAP